VTARRGKPKTAATAAFLGESELFRQKVTACCVNVTNSARQSVLDPPKWVASTAAAEVFHILPDTGERFCNFAESDLGRRRLFAVGLEPRVDQRHDAVNHRVVEPFLPGDQLHQLVGAFDIGSAVL
jgi:hypothetical protein